jgi:hypothetical protein
MSRDNQVFNYTTSNILYDDVKAVRNNGQKW